MKNSIEIDKNAFSCERRKGKKRKLWKCILRNWRVYVMFIPVALFYILFSYTPMYGIIIAFKDYYASMGILGSPWVGFKYFEQLLKQTPQFWDALRNTVVISVLKLCFCFPVPIIMSLFLNEIVFSKFKKAIQTAIYLPNFISWVVISGIIYELLSVNGGLVNNILMALGLDRVSFLTQPKMFYPILILSDIWKSAGWGTVIYISAISGISPELYDAAEVDGCGRFGKMWRITLPCIKSTISMMLILQIGNIMNAGFDQVFNLYNKAVASVGEILDTLAYNIGIANGLVEKGAALGLFKTVINFVLLIGANFASKKLNGVGLYE